MNKKEKSKLRARQFAEKTFKTKYADQEFDRLFELGRQWHKNYNPYIETIDTEDQQIGLTIYSFYKVSLEGIEEISQKKWDMFK